MPKIISRKKAKEVGLKKYFTGKPCPYGHLVYRLVADYGCIECGRNNSKIYQSLNRKNFTEKTKDRVMFKKYGLSRTDIDRMRDNQNNLCAICGKQETAKANNKRKIKSLSVDHCHKTGDIRGLLCMKCNTTIRFFEYYIEFNERIINYLNKKGNNHGT